MSIVLKNKETIMLDNEKYDELLKEMKEKLNKGFSRDEILNDLEQKKVSIVDAVKVTRDLFVNSLARAKDIVATHPAWTKSVEAYEKFHNDLYDELIKQKELFEEEHEEIKDKINTHLGTFQEKVHSATESVKTTLFDTAQKIKDKINHEESHK